MAHHSVDYYAKVFYATNCRFIMPQTDKNGRVLVIFKTVDAFQQFPDYLQHLIEMDDLIFESLLMLPRVQQNGITVICDLQGLVQSSIIYRLDSCTSGQELLKFFYLINFQYYP